MKTEFVITSDKDYQETMVIIYDLMNKGEEKLTDNEILKLEEFALATENYEDEVLHLKPVKKMQSLKEVLELFMYENKLTQSKLADKLEIGKPKLSQILTGKRQPDVLFLKALYRKLNIDPKLILEHV